METPRILIIEDEENIRQTMRLALETEGYIVETAVDGTDGWRRFLDGEGWDLVFLDQRMPGMEGVELLHKIREIDKKTPIVMITAYATVELAQDALGSRASGFLRKPFTPAGLRQVAHDLLSREKQP